MKKKLLGLGLIVTIISTFQIPALANDKIAAGSKTVTRNIVNITPFDLVYSAYKGQMSNFDIPSYVGFLTAVKTNRLDSQMLVQSAIDSGRLEPEMIDDRTYLNSVQSLLELKLKD